MRIKARYLTLDEIISGNYFYCIDFDSIETDGIEEF